MVFPYLGLKDFSKFFGSGDLICNMTEPNHFDTQWLDGPKSIGCLAKHLLEEWWVRHLEPFLLTLVLYSLTTNPVHLPTYRYCLLYLDFTASDGGMEGIQIERAVGRVGIRHTGFNRTFLRNGILVVPAALLLCLLTLYSTPILSRAHCSTHLLQQPIFTPYLT